MELQGTTATMRGGPSNGGCVRCGGAAEVVSRCYQRRDVLLPMQDAVATSDEGRGCRGTTAVLPAARRCATNAGRRCYQRRCWK